MFPRTDYTRSQNDFKVGSDDLPLDVCFRALIREQKRFYGRYREPNLQAPTSFWGKLFRVVWYTSYRDVRSRR